MKSNKYIFVLAILLIFELPVAFVKAQRPDEGKAIDKIIAIVGKEIIMLSDLNGQLAVLAQQSPSVNITDPAIRNKVLDAMINEKLVITKAIEDSIEVTDDEVEARWDALLKNLVTQYGSEKRIEDVYQMSISRLKSEYRDEIKKNILSMKIREKNFKDIKCSPREVEEFYDKYKDSLEKIPPEIELYHIVKYIKASNTAKEEAFSLAKKLRDSIVSGKDFAEFAKKYSADIGSAPSGGDLGWSTKGKLVPEFENAAFALQTGEISLPVETPFGFHIIQVLDKKKDAVLVRHILIKIGQTSGDQEEVKNFLLDLKKKVESGTSFEELAKQFSDDKDTRGFGGKIGNLPLSDLPENMKDIVNKLKDGGVSDPLQYSADPTKQGFHIIYRKKFIPEHIPTLKDDFSYIEQHSIAFKQSKVYQDWIDGLRKTLYWEIKK